MSVPATGGVPTAGAGEEVVDLPDYGDAGFARLMDALAPEPEGEEGSPAAGEAGAAAAPAPAGGADAGSGGDGQAGSGTAADAPVAGEDRVPAAQGADSGAAAPGDQGAPAGDPQQPAATPGAGDQPGAGAVAAAEIVPKLGQLSTALEENTTKAYQAQAYEAVREEHGNYFDALEQHPRLLVGTEVPRINGEGMEVLRDTADAKEWQEAVKSLLVAEIRDRASRDLEENADFLARVHASIELFQNNTDLIPNTREFDRDLADRFAEMAKPYELRVDGKLQGYSIPVQPLVNSLRAQLSAERAAKTAPPAAPTPTPAGGAQAAPAQTTPPAAPEPPQAGIPSKAGNSNNAEDFSTLFGTIGLPNLQI